MSDLGPIRVVADEDIADLIPGYLEHRAEDVAAIHSAIDGGDFEVVRVLGHSMKGSGGGYGFDGVTEIGAALEAAGKEADPVAATHALAALEDYLRRVEVIYE